MTRLVALLQALAILAMSLALAAYLLGVARPNASTPDAGVIAAFGAPLAALAAGVWTALRERTDGGG